MIRRHINLNRKGTSNRERKFDGREPARVMRINGRVIAAALVAGGYLLGAAATAHAFPWSIDMFRGPAIQPLEVAPRVMPDGVLPVDGIHYNVHYGQPSNLPGADEQAPPAMKLEAMTVKMHNPLQPTPDNLQRGANLFASNCSPCHGSLGRGDGTVVHLLAHKPADLLTGVSKNLPEGYIYGYIRNGGIWMPSYGDAMSSNERWQVVMYLRQLQGKYGSEEAAAPAPSTDAGTGSGEDPAPRSEAP
ncbi:MAG: c-type cytochrome [Gammaproteobacteria bacterium]